MSKVIISSGKGKGLSIDQDDFYIVSKILAQSCMENDTPYHDLVHKVIGIRENDDDCRVHSLNFSTTNLFDLSQDIGEFASLNKLSLEKSKIRSLPVSIGQLKNLKVLCLRKTESLLQLPMEIGDLASLMELDLSWSNIKSLPASIGQLKNLKVLNLRKTESLLRLPKEIGDLDSLMELDLADSSIKSLPASIGQLKNLKDLDIRDLPNLLQLPKEIGDLAGLMLLHLSGTNIKSLPASIGQLKNLQQLWLVKMKKLLELPEEIGGLANLSTLVLRRSSVRILPASIGNLVNLTYLDLEELAVASLAGALENLTHLKGLGIGNTNVSAQFLMTLTHRCKFLGCLSLGRDSMDDDFQAKLGFALACNRARSHLMAGIGSGKNLPLLLSNSLMAFQHDYHVPIAFVLSMDSPRCKICEADAIYELLANQCRENFLLCLINGGWHTS